MANRTTFSNLSAPPVPGGGPTGFLQQYSERMKQLFDASALPLTAIGGTANAVTATLDPVLDGSGLVDGMKFTLTFAATNTGGMTLAINGGSAIAILDNQGAALVAGAVASGMRALLEYIGGSFRILSRINASAAGGGGPYAITITASTTWARPAGYADDTLVRIQAWGAGGGGGAASGRGGGGGGAYIERIMRYADVPASVVCTIGAGGAAGLQGGNTTFGALVTAFGGGGGGTTAGNGGGGAGELAAGGTNAANGGGGASPGGGPTHFDGGTNSARTLWGGAGGANSSAGAAPWNGAPAVFGGGGGGMSGGAGGAGGLSLFGGNGGAGNAAGVGGAGSAPGGGGGGGTTGGGAGGRGEIRIQILG
jgi:hypothetical protein